TCRSSTPAHARQTTARRVRLAARWNERMTCRPRTSILHVKGEAMANTKGTGLLMVWADVPADKEAEFNRWYNEEHLAERLSIPGFLSGARHEAVKGGPKHLADH